MIHWTGPKRIERRLWAAAITCFLAVSMTALVLVSTAGTASASVKLTLWDWFDARAELYRIMADEYREIRPDVEIAVEVMPWDEFWNKLALSSTSGVGPDITQFHNEQYAKFEGLLAPFPKDLFPPAQMASEYLMFNEAFVLDGEFYYMPAGIMSGLIFYNRDLIARGGFQSVPSTWAELIDMAQKLTRTGGDGRLEQAGFIAQDLGLFLDLLYQKGGYLYGEDGVTWGDQPGREAMQLFAEFFRSGVSTSPTRPLDGSFETGQAAMRYNWTWYGAVLQSADVDWDVAVLPTETGSPLPARGRNNYESGLAVPEFVDAERKRLAFEFIRWLYNNDEFQVRINAILGRVPGKIELWQLPEVRDHKIMSTLAVQAPYTVFAGPIPGWTWETLGAMYDEVINERVDPLVALAQSVEQGNARFQETPPKWIVERRYQPPGR